MRWDAEYQQSACTCRLPRKVAPSRGEPYPEPPRPRSAPPIPDAYVDAAIAAGRTESEPGYRLNGNAEVAVSTEVFWNEDMATCPRGVKVQLLGAGGVAMYFTYNGDPFWVGWAPVPRRRPA